MSPLSLSSYGARGNGSSTLPHRRLFIRKNKMLTRQMTIPVFRLEIGRIPLSRQVLSTSNNSVGARHRVSPGNYCTVHGLRLEIPLHREDSHGTFRTRPLFMTPATLKRCSDVVLPFCCCFLRGASGSLICQQSSKAIKETTTMQDGECTCRVGLLLTGEATATGKGPLRVR